MKFGILRSVEILERTPEVLKSQLLGLDQEWIMNNEGERTWSPFDVLGHLIHGEETDWIPRLKLILESGTTIPFEPFDRFAQEELSKGKTFADLITQFTQLRAENMRSLKALNLTSEDMVKRGIHPSLGAVTVQELLASWVVHDLSHMNQINRVLINNYKEEVGPWKKYLTQAE